MKTAALISVVLALTGACSSTTSDRPATQDERRAQIENDQERVATEHRATTVEDDTRENDAPDTDARENEATADGAAHQEADNTGRNERDDEPGKLTAFDQSNSASDVDITQAIRKKVVGDGALSFNAKNVKIITVSGKVTLRGPVESAQESSSIEKSARAVPGVVAVDNQIEVER